LLYYNKNFVPFLVQSYIVFIIPKFSLSFNYTTFSKNNQGVNGTNYCNKISNINKYIKK